MSQTIELDVAAPSPERTDQGWLAYQRRRLSAYPLVMLLIVFFGAGAVAGGGGVYLALRPSAPQEAPSAEPELTISRDPKFFQVSRAGAEARAYGRIVVSNTGRAEVVVYAVSAEANGLRMTTVEEKARWLQPGGTIEIDVTILFDCTSESPVPASTRVLVESADGARSEIGSTMDLAAAGWPATYVTSCEPK
ncbi:hypothetical protein [Catenuloplanes japonicus]|uniref:hypothetical protein n=1 Tax=Catenuloplanes japonicus TaxID=33876 RepID=UPI0012F794B6|nr:hypothetical protein [Catenuloplanes japonicus]